MLPCEPAGRLKARRDRSVRALGISLERRSKFEQSRHKLVAQFMRWHCATLADSHGDRWQLTSFELVGGQLFRFGENFICGKHPIHWNGVALFRWTIKSQRSVAAGSASDLDLTSQDEFAANQTVTFLVE